MLSKTIFAVATITLVSLSEPALGRERLLERDGRPVWNRFQRRRGGQEHPPVIDKLAQACTGGVCGTLAGGAITPLLAAQPECSQQDFADKIIDESKQFDAQTQATMLQLAIEYRQAEKNVLPDFSTNPPTPRNSVFCQKAPAHAELNCLVQAQDPAANGTLFFDPASGKSVQAGSQRNTSPLCSNSTIPIGTTSSSAVATSTATTATVNIAVATSISSTSTTSASTASSTGSAGGIGNFGSCTVPQIEFGAGFDNRKETSFRPTDATSYPHGSAQAIGIITQFMCDQLTNSCKADQTAKDTCKQAQAAAAAQTPKLGVDADAFNAVFGIQTSFGSVQALDDQGNPFGGTSAAVAANSTACDSTATVTVTASAASSTTATATANVAVATSVSSTTTTSASTAGSTGSAGGIGNFGSCTVPQIEFGAGFDNRKETSFRPTDATSYPHGSAQAIGIITQFMCDQLTNSCKADQTAKDTCKQAQAAAAAQTPKLGADADAFNAVFGIQTSFSSVQALDDQGNPFGGTSAAVAVNSTTTASAASATVTASAASSTGSAGGIGNFGSCTVPQIEFGAGFDNRKETSFRPTDATSYPHGSAQAIGIITQFMCDQLTNSCKADQTAKDTCKQAQAAAAAQTPKLGADADAFNAVFGIQTSFSSVQALDDQGQPLAGSTSGATTSTSPSSTTTSVAAATSAAAAAAAATSASAGANFGTCTTPQLEFGAGFDGRKETSFQPTDKTSYDHGSAQNGAIITQFMCDTLVNKCGANQAARDLCSQASTAFNAATPAKSGNQADAFNQVMGIKTNFSAVPILDNQGNVVSSAK